MNRKFVFSMCLIVVSLYFMTQTHYLGLVSEKRAEVPTNTDIGAYEVTIQGKVNAYNLSKSYMIFETKDSKNGNSILLRLNFRGIGSVETLLLKKQYHLYVTLDQNKNPFISQKNTFGFDYDRYLFANGILGQYKIISATADLQNKVCPHCMVLDSRRHVERFFETSFSPSTSGFLKALILGDSDSFENYNQFKNLGLAHIFAISGLHFGLLFKGVQKCIYLPNRWLKSIISIFVMGIFLIWVGASYSAQRAFWIISYQMYANVRNLNDDVFSAIAFSSAMILLRSPWAILSVSFQLSFYAYIMIAVFYKKWLVFKSPNKWIQTVQFSILIQIFMMPATLYYFEVLNLWGAFSNVLIVPLIGLVLPLGLILSMLSMTGLTLTNLAFMEHLVALINLIASKMPFKPFELYGISNQIFKNVVLIIWFYFILKTLRLNKRLKYNVLVFGIMPIILVSNIMPQAPKLYIHFIDVGHGDCAIIQYGERAIAVDTGDGFQGVESHLSGFGILYLDFIVLSHAHHDHIGGLEALIKAYPVKTVLTTLSTSEKLNNSNTKIVEKPKEISWMPGVTFLIQPLESDANENDDSLVLQMTYGSHTALFLGDISIDKLRRLALPKSISILKVPHHGSKTSLYAPLYKDHNVLYAIVSHNSKYNFPSESVIETLALSKIKTFSTYCHGGISFELDPKGINYHTFLSDNGVDVLYNEMNIGG
ncbi:DNA internalization-related competence protein ComEC/Rec2 [Fusibacter tunisiensis]|uniref:Competence protein ComEC n=1 Tax=Fusibacter tunisiensis TaxID=1008308 RepID=A0ABS2MMV6_9FIRM|nr:competence protein ComEC [Fusibacter tunisiensis]